MKERCKREDIALKIIKGFLEKDCYTDTELEYSLNTLLDLYNKQKEENKKDIKGYSKMINSLEEQLAHKTKEIKELNSEFALNTEIHKRDEEIKELKDTIKCLHEPAENYISKDKVKDIIKCLDHEPYTAFDAYGELLYDTEIDIKQKLEKLL